MSPISRDAKKLEDDARLERWIVRIVAVGMVLYSIYVALRLPIGAWFDPKMFVKWGLKYAETGSFLYDRSPPLRYVPYSFLFWIVGAEGNLAWYIAAVFTSLIQFTVVPAIAYLWIRKQNGISNAVLVTVGILLVLLIGWPRVAYYGKWQYVVCVPYILLGAWWGDRLLKEPSRRNAILAGAFYAIAGLIQITFTGLALIALFGVLVAKERYRSSGIVAITGLPAVPLLFMSKRSATRTVSAPIQNVTPETQTWLYSASEIVNLLLTPGVIVLLGLAVTTLVAIYVAHDTYSYNYQALLLVFVIAWGLSKFTGVQDYLAYVTVFLWVPLSVGFLLAEATALVRVLESIRNQRTP